MMPTILVLMGGPSLEHDVSLVSGSGMVQNLPEQYEQVHPVFISKEGLWSWNSKGLDTNDRQSFDLNQYIATADHLNQSLPQSHDLPGEVGQRFALLGLHGGFGEDGKVQAYLELIGIPYSGSRVLGSALAMNKIKTKEIYRHYQIPTANWFVLDMVQWSKDLKAAELELGYPMILKDPAGGSSYNITRAENTKEAIRFLQGIEESSGNEVPLILAEECIVGKECSCGYIEGASALPPTEIRPLNETAFFDFEAKYQGKSLEITPAEYPQRWTEEIQHLSALSHQVLELKGYSRTDFITTPEGVHFALETNTLPGFTPSSLLPQQAECIGWGYSELLHQIIQRGWQS